MLRGMKRKKNEKGEVFFFFLFGMHGSMKNIYFILRVTLSTGDSIAREFLNYLWGVEMSVNVCEVIII